MGGGRGEAIADIRIANGTIGYIHLLRFNEYTQQELKEAFDRLTDKKVKGIILDLSGNHGGYLDVGTLLRLSYQRFYAPTGRCIQMPYDHPDSTQVIDGKFKFTGETDEPNHVFNISGSYRGISVICGDTLESKLAEIYQSAKSSPLELLYCRPPSGGELYGMLAMEIEKHHHRLAHALHLVVVHADKTLSEGEAAVPDVHYCRLHVDNLILGINLAHEVSIKMYCNNGVLLSNLRTHLLEIVHLCRVVILEIHSVVHMPESIGIHPSQLYGHGVMIFNLAHIVCFILELPLYTLYSSPFFRSSFAIALTRTWSFLPVALRGICSTNR